MSNFFVQEKFEPFSIHNSMTEDGIAPIVKHFHNNEWCYGFCYHKFDNQYLAIISLSKSLEDIQEKYFEKIEYIPESFDKDKDCFHFYKQYNSKWRLGLFKKDKWSYIKSEDKNQILRILKK